MTVPNVDTTALAERVAERAEGDIKPGKTLQEMIREQMPEVAKGLPPGTLTAERFIRTMLTEIRRNPDLVNCTVPSFLGAMMQSAQLGLEVGNALGQAYLIPYRDKKKGITECQFQIGYKGWISLGARMGSLIESREVRQFDDFGFRFGTNPFLEHSWDAAKPRGELTCFYATATMPDGRMRFHVMSIPEIYERRDRSAAVRAGVHTPWETDHDAMCRKTVIRAIIPQLPMSAELNSALSVDEATVNRDRQGELRSAFPDSIDVQPLEPGDLEVHQAHPLSPEQQILKEVIDELEDDQQRLALSNYLLKRYGPITEIADELVQEATDIALGWPDTREQEPIPQPIEVTFYEPPEAVTSPAEDTPSVEYQPPPTDGVPVENEPSPSNVGFSPGPDIPYELAEDTMTRIMAWDMDTVNRILREWGIKVHGNAGEKNRRLTLYQTLVVARANNNRGAVDLF